MVLNLFTEGGQSNEEILHKAFDGLNAYVTQFREMLDLDSDEPSPARERAFDKIIESLFIHFVEVYITRLALVLISQPSFRAKLSEMPGYSGL